MKIETVSIRSGVTEADCTDLEGTLAAMSPQVRDRVKLMLNGIEIQTEYSEPTMAFAARYILRLAQNIWEHSPGPVTRSARDQDTPTRFRAGWQQQSAN